MNHSQKNNAAKIKSPHNFYADFFNKSNQPNST